MMMYSKAFFSVFLILPLHAYIQAQGPPVFSSPQSAADSPKFIDNRFDLKGLEKFLQGADKFSLEFLKQTSNAHVIGSNRSYMVSPFTVWSVLLMLTEGAGGDTLTQLRNTLNIDDDQTFIRAAYQTIRKYLLINSTSFEIASFHAIFTDNDTPINRDYENIIERDYNSTITAVDFFDTNNTLTKINGDIREATRGLIKHAVSPQDFEDANILVISSLYFMGKWEFSFETSKTVPHPFKDEDGKVLGNVPMMVQKGPFIYSYMEELEGHVVELPYGTDNRLSMLVILPKQGVKLNKVVNNLVNVGHWKVLQELQASADDVTTTQVFIPKFTIESNFPLSPILKNMGIVDLFNPGDANLTYIADDNYVSNMFHATSLIVNEEGTEAAAVTVAVLETRGGFIQFLADRPFAYVIVEKTTNVLLFAGEFRSNV